MSRFSATAESFFGIIYDIRKGRIALNSENSVVSGKNPVNRFLAAIEYPDRMPDGEALFTLRVDGSEVFAEEFDGRLVLYRKLTDDDSLLPTLADYAVGRMLKEDAALSYGQAAGALGGSADGSSAFLWQDVRADADAGALLRFFETFMDSCDWWRARVDALVGNAQADGSLPETMVIMP